MLRNGVANDDVAFWDVPGHSGRVGSELSDRHIHRRRRSVWGWGCQDVNRLRGFTSTLAPTDPHSGHPLNSPARTKPRSQLTSRRTVGLRYGERGIKEAMVSTEFAGDPRGIHLTSRRGSWRRQELKESGTAQNASSGMQQLSQASRGPQPIFPAPFPPPRNPGAHPSPHPRGLISPHPPPGSSWWVRPRGAARRPEGGPSLDRRWPYPIPTRARRGGQRGASCGQRGQRRSGRGPRVCGAPSVPKGRAWSVAERGALPARPGSWPASPVQRTVRRPELAPCSRM